MAEFYSKEEIQKLKEITLLDYLSTYEPDNLIKTGSTFKTKEHGSLVLFADNSWYWYAQGIGGKSALGFLTNVREVKFKEAIDILASKSYYIVRKSITEVVERKPFILPEKNNNNDRLINYLKSRGIHLVVINYALEKNLIYEDKNNHNAVFIGYDKNDKPKYATKRGTTSIDYKKEVTGSQKKYAFKINAINKECDTLHIFESAIDALSFSTFSLYAGRDWKNENLLSLGGVSSFKTKKENEVLKEYFSNNKNIKNIHLHLDNDSAGRNATDNFLEQYKDTYNVVDAPPKKGKDINENLQILIKKKQNDKVLTR